MIPKNVEITGIDVCYHQLQELPNAWFTGARPAQRRAADPARGLDRRYTPTEPKVEYAWVAVTTIGP